MKKRTTAGLLALAAVTAAAIMASSAGAAGPATIFDAIPSPLPPNLPSLGFQATQTAEFGDQITFAGTNRRVTSVTVTMSDWAKHSTYPAMPAAGFVHPITLNLYNVAAGPSVGAPIAGVTQSFLIPWRPEADPTCPGGTAWRAGDGQCYNGLAFNITFNLNATVPNSIIYGIAYNTNTWGYSPIGAPGPYESLNVGLSSSPPTTGTDVDLDALFWNTMTPGNYTDGGTGGVGTFRQDTLWSPYRPAVAFVAAPPVAVNKDQCKGNGWQTLSRLDGSGFKNQGDCIQYVNTGK